MGAKVDLHRLAFGLPALQLPVAAGLISPLASVHAIAFVQRRQTQGQFQLRPLQVED
jgi:hypothetical protein